MSDLSWNELDRGWKILRCAMGILLVFMIVNAVFVFIYGVWFLASHEKWVGLILLCSLVPIYSYMAFAGSDFSFSLGRTVYFIKRRDSDAIDVFYDWFAQYGKLGMLSFILIMLSLLFFADWFFFEITSRT